MTALGMVRSDRRKDTQTRRCAYPGCTRAEGEGYTVAVPVQDGETGGKADLHFHPTCARNFGDLCRKLGGIAIDEVRVSGLARHVHEMESRWEAGVGMRKAEWLREEQERIKTFPGSSIQ